MSERMRKTLEKVTQELAANKQKAAILGVLLLLLLVAVGRVIFARAEDDSAAAVPAVAAAAPPVDPTVPQARPVAEPLSSTGSEGQARPPAPAAGGASPAKAAALRPGSPGAGHANRSVSVKDLPRSLGRDLFTTPAWSQFPREGGAESAGEDGQTAASGPSVWEQVRGVLSQRREQRIREVDQFMSELSQLTLQSTMTGPIPMAYISGRLVHEGETINGFSVVQIEEKRVKLRKNGITRPLVMP